MPDSGDFNRELAAAARGMQGEDSSQQAMERAVLVATEILPGCDAAGVCVVHRGERVDTHATSTAALPGTTPELAPPPSLAAPGPPAPEGAQGRVRW